MASSACGRAKKRCELNRQGDSCAAIRAQTAGSRLRAPHRRRAAPNGGLPQSWPLLGIIAYRLLSTRHADRSVAAGGGRAWALAPSAGSRRRSQRRGSSGGAEAQPLARPAGKHQRHDAAILSERNRDPSRSRRGACARAATTARRLGSTPSSTRRWRTASARSRDSLRFSSSVPGSSAWPSMAASNSRHRFSHCACAASAMRARRAELGAAGAEEDPVARLAAQLGLDRRVAPQLLLPERAACRWRQSPASPRAATVAAAWTVARRHGAGAARGVERAELPAREPGGRRIGEAGDEGLESSCAPTRRGRRRASPCASR